MLMTPLIIPAKWFTPLPDRLITTLVVHQQQAPLEVGAAEATARYFQNLPPNKKASAHRVYDPGTVVQSVAYHDIAYHCKGLNSRGAGFELPGYSNEAHKDDWKSPAMEAAMSLCAGDMVALASERQIPLVWLDFKDLLKGVRMGITSHVEATKAGIMGNNHTDPGAWFPVGRFMEIIHNQHGSHLPPPVAAGKFTGGEMGFAPTAGVGFISSAEAGLPGTGSYTLTADGGIQAEVGTFLPPTGAWNYLGLPPQTGDRFFLAITPNLDGTPGYTLWSNDGARYAFGPGKNGWPA